MKHSRASFTHQEKVSLCYQSYKPPVIFHSWREINSKNAIVKVTSLSSNGVISI